MLNRTEILAPAGSVDAVAAAVDSRADAVYLGGSMFSARAFAGNFDTDELLKTIDYCHVHDVKVYMAVNTLLKNEEIERLPDFVEPYYCEGVDGIIVQDVGVASVLARCYPDLHLHGSTQMSVSSEYGARLLKNIGMTRFVPSRELSLAEIKSIKEKVDIEVETFVHGAMCYCYSGRCLMSSFAGGRSGNRGRCAQPCRKKYRIGDTGKTEYALSLKDMCMLSDVGALVDAGIDSFKIEGRMKKPEYVAATVQAYREVRDAYLSGEDVSEIVCRHEKILLDVYNRGGFCRGYYFAQNGRDMLASKRPNHTGIRVGNVARVKPPYVELRLCENVEPGDVIEIRGRRADVELTCNCEGRAGAVISLKAKSFKSISAGDEVYRTRNSSLLDSLGHRPEAKVRLLGELKAHVGEPLTLCVRTQDSEVCETVTGDICTAAVNRPVTYRQMIDKLTKTGGTDFEIEIDADVDDNLFVQLGSLNALRRQALEQVRGRLIDRHRRKVRATDGGEQTARNTNDTGSATALGMTVCISDADHVNIVKNYKWIHTVIVDYNVKKYAGELKKSGFSVLLALPEVMRQNKAVPEIAPEFDGVLVKSMDELGMISEMEYRGIVVMAPSMYAYNDEAFRFYSRYSDNMVFMAADELTLTELRRLGHRTIIKLYGHQKVMVTAGCTAHNYGAACHDSGNRVMTLTDDMGNTFYSANNCESCYNIIYNGVPTYIIDKYNDVCRDFDGCYIDLTIEDNNTVRSVLDNAGKAVYGSISEADRLSRGYTRGHYYNGID